MWGRSAGTHGMEEGLQSELAHLQEAAVDLGLLRDVGSMERRELPSDGRPGSGWSHACMGRR